MNLKTEELEGRNIKIQDSAFIENKNEQNIQINKIEVIISFLLIILLIKIEFELK